MDDLRSLVPSETFELCFSGGRCTFQAPGVLIVELPEAVDRTTFEREFGELVDACARKTFGEEVAILFTVSRAEGEPAPPTSERSGPNLRIPLPPPSERYSRRPSVSKSEPVVLGPPVLAMRIPADPPLNPEYTFARFVVGPCNRLAHAASLTIAQSPGKAYNPLFLYGPEGVGKTHLLQAICHHIRSETTLRVVYLTALDFVDRFTLSAERSNLQAFRADLEAMDVLAIDDLQFLPPREKTQRELFSAFHTFMDRRKQLVFASRVPPKGSAGLEGRLTSRLAGGLVSSLEAPEYDTRVAILLRKAQDHQARVPLEVIRLIAEWVPGTTRELEGALLGVLSCASLRGSPATVEIAYTALRSLREAVPAPARPTLPDILRAVQGRFGVKARDIVSRSKTKALVLPRQVAMFLARHFTHLSLEEIGVFFGGRDHSTVLHAVKRIEALMAEDLKLARDIAELEKRLRFPSG